MVAIVAIHIGVGSNVVCSTGLGNARASERGMDNKWFPRFIYARLSNYLTTGRLWGREAA